jgi:hypothetical protein
MRATPKKLCMRLTGTRGRTFGQTVTLCFAMNSLRFLDGNNDDAQNYVGAIRAKGCSNRSQLSLNTVAYAQINTPNDDCSAIVGTQRRVVLND